MYGLVIEARGGWKLTLTVLVPTLLHVHVRNVCMQVWPSIQPYCAQAVGRKDWTPETGERPEAIYTDREYKTQVCGCVERVG
jgi:hypothetical protein